MSRYHADPNRHFADVQFPDAMNAGRGDDIKPSLDFIKNPRALFTRQSLVGLILQLTNRPALIVIAHPAFERDQGPRRRVLQVGLQIQFFQRSV